ncbi:MAG: hypothetical protein HY647_10125 [Acidobacteria bacterium]|nr:hypothetical protein [Acidobacteriota bacterium]
MRRSVFLLLLLWSGCAGMAAWGQEEFLTAGELDAVRDTQEPGKRIVLYLDFAQRRLDAVRENLSSTKPNPGQAVQKNLREYYRVLEALNTTIETARDKRVPVDKPLGEVEKRGGEFLKYLQSLQSKSSPGWSDYRFTVEEAIDMTQDEIAEAKKGSFPEVKEREAPRLPATPPQTKDRSGEEGPPRRGRPAP